MIFNAKNNTVKIDDTEMDYISFGKGKEVIVMIPGLGDGLSTVKGKAFIIAMAYREYAKHYKVYIFSRKNGLKEKTTTRGMAKDQITVMKILGISKADIIGISQGGMIAQYIAIDAPSLVNKLILAVTLSKQNETVQAVINSWIEMARVEDYKSLLIDTAEKSYSEKYLKNHRFLYPILCRLGRPKDFSRFIIQANSCICHEAYDELDKIKCPTLIIGGKHDQIVGVDSSVELAKKISKSELFVYEEFGHAAYEEAKDFNDRVLKFMMKKDNILNSEKIK